MRSQPPTLRRVLLSALAALTIGLGAVSLIAGFSESFPVRLLQGIAVFGAGAVMTTSALYFTRQVGFSAAEVALALSVAAIVGIVVQVPAGHLGDTRGPRRVLTLCMVGAALTSASLALVAATTPVTARPRAFAINGTVIGIAMVIGPPLGALVAATVFLAFMTQWNDSSGR